MNSRQFQRYLAKKGVTFAPGKGGHLTARRNGKVASVPMHGSKKQLGKGLMDRIKKDLGIKD